AGLMPFELTPILISWPVPTAIAVIIVLAIFRRPLKDLIDRTIHVRAPGTAIDTSGQKASLPAATTEALLKPERDKAPAKDARGAADELLRRLPRTEYIRVTEEEIKKLLEDQGIAGDPAQATRALVAIAAAALTAGQMEQINFTIWGSQIRILQS